MIENLLQEFSQVLKELPELTCVGDPLLRTKAEEVEYGEGLKIAERLKTALQKFRTITGIGRGLAAPQIGISKAVFVVYLDDQFQVFINPKIIGKSKINNYFRECCISSLILWADVKRPKTVTLRWVDEKGNIQKKRYIDFEARLIQHEYDHLQGVVNLDRAEVGSIEFVGDITKEKLRNSR